MAGLGSHSSGKVPFDPGWNDPPPLTYSPQTTSNKPRNILNKRVAFPLTSSCPPGTTSTAPPISSGAGDKPQPTINSFPPIASNVSEEIPIESEQALREVRDTLSGIVDNSPELGAAAGDIRKRIVMLGDSWKSGKLNPQAQCKMWKLVTALKDGRPREANELHKALAVEHAGAVGVWMPAIRRLIHHSVAKHDLLSIDKDNDA